MILINDPPSSERLAFYENYLNMYCMKTQASKDGYYVCSATGDGLNTAEQRIATELAQRCGIDFTEVK